MIARLFALGAVALGVAACGPQPNPQAPEYGLVNPNTGKLYPEYLDASYSLAPLYEQRMKRKLANSDRRAMDGALDAAFASAEGEGPHSWRSAATGRSGGVELISWDYDRRTKETCGTFSHYGGSRGRAPLEGVAVFCRAEADAVWFLDEATWGKGSRVKYGRGSSIGRRTVIIDPPATTRPSRPSRPSRPPVRPGDGAGTPPGATSPSGQFGGAYQRPVGSNPPPCPDAPGGGAQTLGDCLAPRS